MKRIFSIVLLFTAIRLYAQTPFDGPYVLYTQKRTVILSIERNGDLLRPKEQDEDHEKDVELNVIPQDHPDWAFTVKLRDTLITDPVAYPEADKTLFISDIEGEFANFRKLLLAAKVIDEHYNWTYGKGALVIPGDLFDRGPDVVPELWLLYKLEDEAKAAGGSCQVILGNHDIMNLSGDHRYTDGKYFKNAWLIHCDINALFGKNTELGRWLRTKNIIEKTGDVLVMHGGLSPAILQKDWSLQQLNSLSRPYYDMARNDIPDSLQVLFGNNALFWYRGYFIGTNATMAEIDSTLKQYHCKHILVGHTIVKWNIASYYGGKVIGIDVDEHTNHIEAALLEKGKWYTIGVDGRQTPLLYEPKNDKVSEKDIL